MKVIKETIGDTTVFIQAVDEVAVVVGETQTGRSTQTTSIEEELTHAYAKLKSTLKGFAEDIGMEVKNINADTRPKEVGVEFSMSLSTQLGAWIFSEKGDCALKVTMIWSFSEDQGNA